jgi:hypothetical protein
MITPVKSFLNSEERRMLNMFERDTLRPDEVQTRFLLRILRQNRYAEYGKKYDFSGISDGRRFREKVPLVEYSDLKPYMDKIRRGKQEVLTTEPVSMFARTSGTTAEPKYVPVTASGRRRTGILMRQWLNKTHLEHPSFLDREFLMITGAAVEGYLNCGIPYGSTSGMIYTSLPREIRKLFAIPLCMTEIDDYDLRYYLMARISLGKQISFIVTPSPLTLLKLAETIIIHQEEIIRSIHNGWLSAKLQTSKRCTAAGIPCVIVESLSPDKKRARSLGKILEKEGELLPCRCWPNLSLIGCWLGGSVGFHAGSLDRYYGKVPKRDIGYMASEGCFNLPCQDSIPSGILAIRNNYYEFIPEGQAESSARDLLSVGEIKEGACYKILLTNESGLYRYDINDIVKVDGFHNRTPLISFVRKDVSFLNIAGEKLHINHFLIAIKDLKSDFSIDIHQFRVVPDNRKLRYELLLDIRTRINPGSIRETLVPAIDALLRECNIEYDAKRKSGRLNAPCIHVMKPSWEEKLRRSHISEGRRDIQYKWVHITEKFMDADRPHIKYTID